MVLTCICGYLGRPVIATSRIDSYDGENVTFHYNRHEDDQLVTETLPALKCPTCGAVMRLLDLYYKHERVSLEEMYERAMAKARAKGRGYRSPAHA